jgi:hypothetical protein
MEVALPRELIERWPTPDGVRSDIWQGWSVAQRRDWLVHQAYEETDGELVVRADPKRPEIAEQVVQAVTSVRGAVSLAHSIRDDFSDTWEHDWASSTSSDADASAWVVHAGPTLMALLALLLIALVVSFLATDMFGLGGGLSTEEPDSAEALASDEGEAIQEDETPAPAGGDTDEGGDPPTREELEAQEPIPLTDGAWRIFVDPSESAARWDVIFLGGGECSIPGDSSVVSCTYTESHPAVEITLARHDEPEARNADGDVRVGVVDWSEWFHMTRVGNTMYGQWEIEGWIFSYDDGLQRRENAIFRETAFIRPVQPSDP